jgi:hypothetical protein
VKTVRRGSTPTNTFNVDINLTGATVFVSYEQDGIVVIEKTGSDLTITPDQVSLTLSQEDTLAFRPGEVMIQLRYVFPNGVADASNIIRAQFERIIKDGVIP